MMMFTSGPPHCRPTITSGGLHRLQIQPQHYNRGNVKLPHADFGLKLNATSKYLTQGVEGASRSGDVKVIKRIESMLESMEDGEISFSAYDTAWVAMIRDVHGSDTPHFPSSLEWISNNQLRDGSWGDHFFSAYDRLISTLACVVALKTWNVHPHKSQKGINFVQQNLNKLEKEISQNMTCGFELIFPSTLELARGVGVEFALASPIIETIYAKREEKLKRIPKDMIHKVPTTLLYSLEALEGIGLNWDQILSLKCKNGSLLNSPSSTAYAFMRTKDENCLQYLTNIVHKFNGPVPHTYPLEMFEGLWVVDRLIRLGISRYFKPQISNQCINYVNRYWKEQGIGTTRNSNVPDLDVTCMAFRLLRLQGHHVSPDVFSNFKKGNEFFCYPGQSDEGVTVMFNFYRASQVLFPGEKILEDAREFAYKFLREKQAANELYDKWLICKDLAGEVEYALDVPWYASLPRVETRYYLEQYGGEDDVWIAKVLYRLPYVNNNTYLEVAKQDYNKCQAIHKCEWNAIKKWYGEFELGDLGLGNEILVRAYFVAAANIFEPERSKERLAWAKTALLVETISAYSDRLKATSTDHKEAFVSRFLNLVNKDRIFGLINARVWDTSDVGKELVRMLLETLDYLSPNAHDRDHLLDAWKDWLGESHAVEAELLVRTIILASSPSQEIFSHPHYHSLSSLTISVCSKLRLYQNDKVHDHGNVKDIMKSCKTTPEIESEMQQLVQLVFDNSLNSMDPQIKSIFLAVAKSFYYTAYFPTAVIDVHAAKVLFEKVTSKGEIEEGIERIQSMFESREGETSVSCYDTAWVSMIRDVHGSDTPQFPSSLEWISNNQLSDGSWGDHFYSAYDRLVNTLACVVALKTWNVHPHKCQKGIDFVQQNLNKLKNEKSQHMTCGFEFIFPSMLELARGSGIELSFDSSVIGTIYAKREEKLKRIPRDTMHKMPTTLLYSLEALEGIGLNWEQILSLKCKDGSLLNSPSSTAYAFMRTKDENCLQYLTNIVSKFNGPVPHSYPSDLFERLWIVDRLIRLGISRYFKPQITNQCINFVKRYWKEQGIGSTKCSNVPDLDDTCMAFRLLRLEGHHVSADVFNNFKKGKEFFCFPGQADEGVTVLFNLYRASQVSFPDENILEDAREFASEHLREKQAANELYDKWLIAKDLAGEVEYGLDVPWYASLPRVETRYYLEQYGGDDDVWIAKVLCRMPSINNNTYLEVAKQDYNNCQALHNCEWNSINKWYGEFDLGGLGLRNETLLRAYFVAAASIFEPERSKERVAWAKTALLVETISAYSDQLKATSSFHKEAFVSHFFNLVNKDHSSGLRNARVWDTSDVGKELVRMLLETLDYLSPNAHDRDHLLDAWKDWLGESHAVEAELLVRTIILASSPSQEIFSHPHYHSLSSLTISVCSKLRLYQNDKVHDHGNVKDIMKSCKTTPEIESEMQQLVQLVFDNSLNSMDPQIKSIFLAVAKSFYYTAYFPTAVIDVHAAKVLFEKVG